MKTEEIVKALRRVRVETGSLACMGCGYEQSCGVHGCRIMREGLDLIERLTDRCARYAEEIAVLQERTRWIPVEERLPIIAHSWGVSDVVLCIISDPSGSPPPNPGLCVPRKRKMDVPWGVRDRYALDAAARWAGGGKLNGKTDN